MRKACLLSVHLGFTTHSALVGREFLALFTLQTRPGST
jgi:hypothetical protein